MLFGKKYKINEVIIKRSVTFMKVANIMNFVRYIDERDVNSIKNQYEATKKELELVNELGVENTFLLQYDAVCSEEYQKLFKENATEKTELGLWYEIVEPLTSACGLPYKSEKGWKWDWHIVPGFSMAYTQKEREMLVDEAMRKFKEVFGYYPKTFASWIFDTHTMNYLAENYEISAFAICRDQYEIDAYSLVGGYFNQGYYPSKNNIFTPAKTDELRVNVPVFRLLGPCPIYNCDEKKYLSSKFDEWVPICTMEPATMVGTTPEYVDSVYSTYFKNEDLGFSYVQLGQENSFGAGIVEPLRMQFKKLMKLKDVKIQKMCDTGEAFKKLFPNKTPATSVVALENWDTPDLQSVYYDCQNYVANIFRVEDKTFIRSLFLFDERVEDIYLKNKCTEFFARYENLPVIETLTSSGDEKYYRGLMIDENATSFNAEKIGEGKLRVFWGDKEVTFEEEKITVVADKLHIYLGTPVAGMTALESEIVYDYRGNKYRLRIDGAKVTKLEDGDIEIVPENGRCELYPETL